MSQKLDKQNKEKNTKFRSGTFILVPNKPGLLKVDAVAQSVYMWLCDHSNKVNWTCFPGIRTLMKECHASRNTIRDRILILKKEKLITVQKRKRKNGTNRSNLYKIILNKDLFQRGGGSINDPYSSKDDLSMGRQRFSNKNHTEQEPSNKKNKENREIEAHIPNQRYKNLLREIDEVSFDKRII